MRIKTFRGRSSAAVLKQIKQVLGDEAVILSTQTSREGGDLICEMVAAVDPKSGPDIIAGGGPEDGMVTLQREWQKFKEQLQCLLAPQIGLQGIDKKSRMILEQLKKEGLSSAALFELASAVKTGEKESLLSILLSRLEVAGVSLNGHGKVLQGIIGPHGVGKTTTLLKLVFWNKKCYQNKRIAIFNADLKQGRGRLFLRHYAQLLGLDYFELGTVQDWSFLEDKLRSGDYSRVFVDLPGLLPEENMVQWLESQQAQILEQGQVYLALSPGYSDAQLDFFLKKYSWAGLSGLIWTKLDEAPIYGPILNLALQAKWPVALLTFGPELSGKMALADRQGLLRLLLKHELPSAGC